MSGLDWNDLRIALAVADEKSLSRAARRLGVHQTTAGRRLDALERALSAPLFARTARGVIPTAAGTSVVALVREVAAALSRLERDGVVDANAPSGVVRIGVTEATAAHVLERALPTMERELPAVTLEIVTGNAPLDVLAGDVDLAVRLMKPEQSELVARGLGTLRYAVHATAGYLARHRAPLEPPLAGHAVIAPSGELAGSPEARWLAKHATGARVPIRSNSMVALADAAARGAGLVVLPNVIAASYRSLRPVAPTPGLAPRTAWLLGRREDQALVRVRRTADILARALRDHIAAS